MDLILKQKTIELVIQELIQLDTNFYKRIDTQLSYPEGEKTQFTLDGKLESSRKSRTKIISIDSEHSKSYLKRGMAYKEIGDIAKANEDLEHYQYLMRKNSIGY